MVMLWSRWRGGLEPDVVAQVTETVAVAVAEESGCYQ